jgi:hypothetical protein
VEGNERKRTKWKRNEKGTKWKRNERNRNEVEGNERKRNELEQKQRKNNETEPKRRNQQNGQEAKRKTTRCDINEKGLKDREVKEVKTRMNDGNWDELGIKNW